MLLLRIHILQTIFWTFKQIFSVAKQLLFDSILTSNVIGKAFWVVPGVLDKSGNCVFLKKKMKKSTLLQMMFVELRYKNVVVY
jgi:hypothetical protein